MPLRTFVPSQWIKKTFVSPVTTGASSSFNGSGAGAGASVPAIAHPQSTSKPRLKIAPHHSSESLMRKVPSASVSSVYAINAKLE